MGKGFSSCTENVIVNIPQGVDDKTFIRVMNKVSQ